MLLRFFVSVLLTLAPPGAEWRRDLDFPTTWHGEWVGTMRNTVQDGSFTDVPVQFTVAPIEGEEALTWRMTYGEGGDRVLKDYTLIREDGPGRYAIDENNGIVLPARLVGDVLYSQFQYGETLLTARHELRGDEMLYEVTSASLREPAEGAGPVTTLDVRVVQASVFRRRE